MSLRWRVFVIALITATAGVVVGVALANAVDRSNKSVVDVSVRWGPANARVNQLITHLVDQETGERGYLLTGQPQYLEPYETGQQAAAVDISTLRLLTAGDAAVTQSLDKVEMAMEQWRVQAARPEIAARGRSEAAAVALARTGVGKRLFDALRQDAQHLQVLVDGRRGSAQSALRAANRDMTTWLWVNVVVSMLVGIGVLAGLVLWVLRPIRRLSAAMQRVSDGELSASVLTPGPGEIHDVSVNAEQMRRRILRELESSEAARQALEQRGPVVLGLSQHLAPRASAPVPGIRYAATLRAAEGMLAGDWVDVIELGNDRVALMLLDVSGHGASAGLEAMRLKTVLTTALAAGKQPHEALALAAAGFSEDERFATALIVVLDAVTGQLRWANGGHLAPRIVPLNVSVVTPETTAMLAQTGPLLSTIGGEWSTRSGMLEVGQMLLAFSDGLTEARDSRGEEFGMEGVCRALSHTRVRDVDTAVSVCLAAVEAHAVDVHRDDITLVAVAREPSSIRAAAPREVSVRDDADIRDASAH